MTRKMKHNCAWILASHVFVGSEGIPMGFSESLREMFHLMFSGLLGLASISFLMIAIPSTSALAGTLRDNFDDEKLDGWDLSGAGDTWEVKNGELVITPRSTGVTFYNKLRRPLIFIG